MESKIFHITLHLIQTTDQVRRAETGRLRGLAWPTHGQIQLPVRLARFNIRAVCYNRWLARKAERRAVNKTNSLLTLALAAGFLTQGCVGIVTRGMETQTFEPAVVARMPATFAVSSNSENGKEPWIENPTSLWLKQHWGEPPHIKPVSTPAQGELWTYSFDRKWCGVIPYIVAPLPLLLPIGRERVVFHICEGRVAKADVITIGGYQAVAGWGPEGPLATSGRWR